MQDPQNYQYYDPSPVAPPEPWWKQRRTWQRAGLALGVVVILVFAGIALANILKNHKLASNDHALMTQADAIASQLEAKCKAGDTACVERAQADAARSVGTTAACKGLTGESLNTCVTLIAQDGKNPDACKDLTGDDQTKCADSAYLLLAKANLDLKLCGKITAANLQSGCSAQVKAKAIATNQCGTAGLDPSLCAATQALKDAIAQGNEAACEALTDTQAVSDCQAAISSLDADADGLVLSDENALGLSDTTADSDGDGLSDGDEVHVYLTDPTKSDTDGDGFSDGTEVQSGYDPLK